MKESLWIPAFMAAVWMTTSAAQAEVRLISGGVGESEEEMIESIPGSYNVRLLTVAGPRGAYLSGVTLRFIDKEGVTAGRFVTEGPIVLADLPPGMYTVEATLNNETLTKKISAPANGRRAYDFRFKTGDD